MSAKTIFLNAVGMCLVASGKAPSPTITVPFSITPAPTHPPFPVGNTPTLPSQFSDIPASVVSCWDAHANYTSARQFLIKEINRSATFSWSQWTTTSLAITLTGDLFINCYTTVSPSLTTLCDGYPRASTARTSCSTYIRTHFLTATHTGSNIYVAPSWSTELDQLPSPTCIVASDFGPDCTKLADAYEWRVTQLQSQTPSPTGSIERPSCRVRFAPTPSAKPACFLAGGSWEAYYWPTPHAFCSGNGTSNATATAVPTPTIPGQANTAVISGLTLTSPSVYHFLRNATLSTYVGRESNVGETPSDGTLSFASSTTAAFLTVAQRESDILTISRKCLGHNKGTHCTMHASPRFLIADLETVRASEYFGSREPHEAETIYQNEYAATVGLAMSDIVKQNSVFGECVWTTPGERTETAGPAAWMGGRMTKGDWHGITATSVVGRSVETAVPGMRVWVG
ncbi:hypothetical protein CC86DRAFT_415556 [Ophiobolus disseminans]|uniref:Uncharacterized protein n=1 Tax=Ophiobolus disseminans TaxID=1469910 RepID=A0A6A7AK45_9PLEO|nr:hypothetical protein CC86DRAFT_415556 [Ophiobolus disseminans]